MKLFSALVCSLLLSTVYAAETCTVHVDAKDQRGRISPQLMGFNTVHYVEPDYLWANGKLEGALKEIKTGVLRWPGGEISSYYHWNNLIGRGQVDTWDPKYDGRRDDPSKYMDLEEYMGHVRAIGCEPMIGVNVESGMKYNRRQDSLDEARALIQHCVDKKYNVKYWFIDNESNLPMTHYQLSPEEYGQALKDYGDVLRSVDPNIEIIGNWHQGWTSDWATLIKMAGRNLNYADFHLYWRRKKTDWNAWLNDTPMANLMPKPGKHPKGQLYTTTWKTYDEMFQEFKSEAAKINPDLKLAVLEWNIDPPTTTTLSRFQTSLMQAEQFGIFINNGVTLGCFWPMNWPTQNDYRTMVNHKTGALQANYQIFRMYADCLGQTLLGSRADAQEVRTVAALSEDQRTMYIYLLRKSHTASPMPIRLDLQNFTLSSGKAKLFHAENLNSNEAQVTQQDIQVSSPLTIQLPEHCFMELVLIAK